MGHKPNLQRSIVLNAFRSKRYGYKFGFLGVKNDLVYHYWLYEMYSIILYVIYDRYL